MFLAAKEEHGSFEKAPTYIPATTEPASATKAAGSPTAVNPAAPESRLPIGFTGIGVPREYGGAGGGAIEVVIAVSAFAKKCMASAATLSIHLIVPHILAQFGTEEQKQTYDFSSHFSVPLYCNQLLYNVQ